MFGDWKLGDDKDAPSAQIQYLPAPWKASASSAQG
jgi:hypothetical protein